MDYKTLQAKFHYLSKDEATDIAKYMNEKRDDTKQQTAKKYEGAIECKKREILDLETHRTNGNKYMKIAEFIISKEVKDNYDWLLNPNCKNRDFNAGFHSAIEQIKAIINSDKDKVVKVSLNLF